MLVEIPQPFLYIKRSAEGDLITLELWRVPDGEEFQKLLEACVASELLLVFEGDFKGTRQECQAHIDRQYPDLPVLSIDKETVIEAVEKG